MGAWIRIKDFSGWGDATYLWPRWLVLRAVGLVFVLIFAGILKEGQVLVGPKGLIPLSLFFQDLHVRLPSVVEAFLQAPSLFWAGTSAAMITLVAWMGMLAAIALVLNLWPRLALLGCWVALLSFVTTWGIFSGSQVDQLMLETALLCIPFAPAGYRPGLGAASPPRPIAVFIVRWLLFRVMFESGVAKLIAGDPRWWNGTAMDVLYETSPFPTILGYLDHQLPHGYHLFEMALTYAAEFLAPLLAVFAGRRGRWVAFWIWVIFQAGIQLTNNFGWLNTVSIALGVLLLDDQMLVAAAEKLRWLRLGQFLSKTTARGWPTLALATAGAHGPPALARWRLTALRTALWAQFGLTLFFFATYFGMPVSGFPYALGRPLKFGLENFRAANPYTLYGGLLTARYAVEFEGSNDAGVTWRPYEYHYQPQRPDRMGPFIAPWYPRFEATLQIEATHQTPSPLYALVAQHLLQDDQAVIGLFRRNPFPGAPPTLIRMPVYQLTFTDATMRRATGNFWHKELQGEYLPMMSIDAA
ncbi:MAG: lipase maturation factor family protein, partial [Opitutaceae bacterium]